ncbi:MAG: hypothetical protein AAF546_11860 [Verrucomicrobiota bacterium]
MIAEKFPELIVVNSEEKLELAAKLAQAALESDKLVDLLIVQSK